MSRQRSRFRAENPDYEEEEDIVIGGIRIKPVEESDEIQSRNVRLTVRGRLKTYCGGQTTENVEIEESEYCVVNFTTQQELIDGIRHEIDNFKIEILLLEHDSPKKVIEIEDLFARDGFSEDHMERFAQQPNVIDMYISNPIDFRRLKGADVNRVDLNDSNQFNCVVEYLLKTYSVKIPTLSRAKILNLMSNYSISINDNVKKLGWNVSKVQLFCDHYKISHYVLDSWNRLVHKKLYNTRNYGALMYYCVDAHMYPIVDKTTRIHIQKVFAEKTTQQTSILDRSNEKKREEAEKAKIKLFNKLPFREDVSLDELDKLSNCVVYYHKLHLKSMLLEFYKTKHVLYNFKHTSKIVTYIEYDNGVHLFANANHKAGRDWNTSMEIAKRLQIPYTNQSLASLSQQYFEKHYHPKGKKQARRHIKDSVKLQILRQQGGCCKTCRIDLKDKKYDCDHIVPISCGGDALALTNLQILCVNCHNQKSSKEAAEMICNIDNSASYYNERTMEIFAKKPMNAIVHNFIPFESYAKDVRKGKKILAGLDIEKCRTNILRFGNTEEWNCFSVLNDPVKYDEEIHGDFPRGFYYVKSKNLLPLKGNSWICVSALQYCLKNKIIERSQIKFVVLSSLSLPANYFQKFVTDIMSVVEDAKIWKLMVNAMVGLLGVRKINNRDFKIETNKNSAAAYIYDKQSANQSVTITPGVLDEDDEDKYDKNGNIKKVDYYEIMFSTERMKEESHFPIFAQILQEEACELHKIKLLLEKHGGELVYSNTDNCIALFDNQKQIDAMNKEADTIFWDAEKKVKKYKPANEINDVERMDRINTEVYELTKLKYKVEKDPEDNNFEKLAKKLVNHGKSFQVDAMAGCGKTTLLREVMKLLDARDQKCLSCTPTHKSAKILYQDKEDPKRSTQTINAALAVLKHGSWSSFSKFSKYDWIIVDEKSMVKENFFMLLYKIKKACINTKFIICGDWGQLPPVMDRSLTFNYADSFCIYDLCDGNMMKLNVCRRSDRALFDLYSDVSKVDADDFPSEMYKKNICFYNSTRKKVNFYWMNKLRPKKCMVLKKHPSIEQSQDVILYKDLPLIATCTRMGLGFANCDEFVVVSYNKKEVVLKFECDDEEDEKEIIVPVDELTKIFAPAYCISTHRAQGSSIGGPFGIFDFEKMNEALKYVALSRSRKLRYINLCSVSDLEEDERDL
jgi:5-methylcytosine-specific restriction endonuclease McrA